MYKTTSSQKQNYSVQVECNHKYLQIEEEEEGEGDTTNEMGKMQEGKGMKAEANVCSRFRKHAQQKEGGNYNKC